MGSYSCLYLGSIQNVSIMSPVVSVSGSGDGSGSSVRRGDGDSSAQSARSADIQLIDRVDNAQLDGRIPYAGNTETHGVTVTISKHGLKITESPSRGGNVVERVPLHMVAQAVSYDDGWGRWNVAIKTGQVGKNQFVCHVFQAHSETDAERLCQAIREIFTKIVTPE